MINTRFNNLPDYLSIFIYVSNVFLARIKSITFLVPDIITIFYHFFITYNDIDKLFQGNTRKIQIGILKAFFVCLRIG